MTHKELMQKRDKLVNKTVNNSDERYMFEAGFDAALRIIADIDFNHSDLLKTFPKDDPWLTWENGAKYQLAMIQQLVKGNGNE